MTEVPGSYHASLHISEGILTAFFLPTLHTSGRSRMPSPAQETSRSCLSILRASPIYRRPPPQPYLSSWLIWRPHAASCRSFDRRQGTLIPSAARKMCLASTVDLSIIRKSTSRGRRPAEPRSFAVSLRPADPESTTSSSCLMGSRLGRVGAPLELGSLPARHSAKEITGLPSMGQY